VPINFDRCRTYGSEGDTLRIGAGTIGEDDGRFYGDVQFGNSFAMINGRTPEEARAKSLLYIWRNWHADRVQFGDGA